MLLRMPKDLRATFSPQQLEAIENALVPRTHQVDVRMLLPFLGKGAYLVLVAGPNRRSQPRSGQPDWPMGDASAMLSSVINVSQLCRNSPNAYHMLQRMPKAITTTFSAVQIQAIENALIPRSHIVDIRLSLPLMGKGAYFVFAAGPNKRAHYRDLQNRNPFVIPAVCASAFCGVAAIAGLVHLKGSDLLKRPDPAFAKEEAFYPTVVPFKKNRYECENSGRKWIDNHCVDKIHDPTF
jgi:hypothetical protein